MPTKPRRPKRRSGRPPLRSFLVSPVDRIRGLSAKYGGPRRLLIWSAVVYGEVPALILARVKHRLMGEPPIVLVSGTYGKTTATRALRALLGQEPDGWADYNANFRGEVGWTLLREPGRPKAYVLEKSDGSSGMHAATRWLPPDVTLVLNLGEEHLDEIASMAELFEVQRLTVERLNPGGCLILNADDPWTARLAQFARVPVIWFGHGAEVDVQICRVTHIDGSLQVTLDIAGQRLEVPTRLSGAHFAATVAGTVGVGIALGYQPSDAGEVWRHLPPTPGRMETMMSANGARVICDDYKSTPETVIAGLNSLTAHNSSKTVAVLGELDHIIPGQADEAYRQVLAATSGVDTLVLLGSTWQRYMHCVPRETEAIAADSVTTVTDLVRPLAQPGTVVYLKAMEEVRLRRVALALTGQQVTCAVASCHLKYIRCEQCALLAHRPSGSIA